MSIQTAASSGGSMVETEGWLSEQAEFAMRVAKVLADPLRVKILEELNKRVMSPKRFFEKFGGGSVTRVWRHFQILLDNEWIEEVEVKTGGKRFGGQEHFYRAIRPAFFDTEAWAYIPKSMQEAFSQRIHEEGSSRVEAAMEARTFDSRDDRHFTSTPLLTDEIGRKEAIAIVDAAFEQILLLQVRARGRFEESGEKPVPMTVNLAAFESPPDELEMP